MGLTRIFHQDSLGRGLTGEKRRANSQQISALLVPVKGLSRCHLSFQSGVKWAANSANIRGP